MASEGKEEYKYPSWETRLKNLRTSMLRTSRGILAFFFSFYFFCLSYQGRIAGRDNVF